MVDELQMEVKQLKEDNAYLQREVRYLRNQQCTIFGQLAALEQHQTFRDEHSHHPSGLYNETIDYSDMYSTFITPTYSMERYII